MNDKVPRFSGKKEEFSRFQAIAKAFLAMKFLGSTLLCQFKDGLPANDQVPLDRKKPDELAQLKCKEMNLHALNILTVMLSDSDVMLSMVESAKSKDWPDGLVHVLWEKLQKKFKSSDQIAKAAVCVENEITL